MKKSGQMTPNRFSSFWFGIFTLILALIGSWISLHAFAAIISGIISGESFSLSGIQVQSILVFLTIIFITPVLTIFLFVLSYRLISGRDLKVDNEGMINPSILIIVSLLTVAVGILGLYFAWNEKELAPVIVGVIFSILGVMGIFFGMKRVSERRDARI